MCSPSPTKPPVYQVLIALSSGIKRSEGKADHPTPSSVKVYNAWNYNSTLTIRLHGVMFQRSGNTFALTYTVPSFAEHIAAAVRLHTCVRERDSPTVSSLGLARSLVTDWYCIQAT
jgi:hypothetical protein